MVQAVLGVDRSGATVVRNVQDAGMQDVCDAII